MTIQRIYSKIAENGRIVIPAALRRAIGLEPGGDVLLRVENGEIRLIPAHQAIKRAQQVVRQYAAPGDSAVGSLVAERHTEALHEAGVLNVPATGYNANIGKAKKGQK